MTESHVERFLDRLRNLDALRDADTVRTGELDRVQPAYADDWPTQLNPDVRRALAATVPLPYLHQADAIDLALSGADIVMESPTASGKTLAFAAPMLHALKKNPGGHAMMIYPMKALAFDQREQIRALCQPLGIDSWPYDGDTDDSEKEQIRKQPPHILLTNPEYLNMSFLGQRQAWNRHAGGTQYLRSLRFVVIDEVHEYRGFFGSNMALLLRRFFLHLDRIDAHPQVFLSTATCANPKEHAKALTGRNVELVSARGTLRPKRSFVFVQPEIPDFRYWDILRHRIEQAAVAALTEGLHVLIFCPTKKFLEEAFGNARRRAGDEGLNPFEISAYHADLKPSDRQDIQSQIKSGQIRVVFTTNALEIGLDVGGLDGVILAGFPPSIMSAWQQIGRAGRGWDRDAFVLFYAMNDPIDRFFVSNLDAFLDKPFDELVVDPGNDELIKRHLPSLLQETGGDIAPSDEAILGGPFYRAASEAQGAPPRGDIPQRRLNLRGAIGQSYILKHGNDELGQVGAMRQFHEAYLGAVFPFFGKKYRVKAHEEKAVLLEECDPHLRTDPYFWNVLTPSDYFDGVGYGDIEIYHGALNIVANFNGYKLVTEPSGEVLDRGNDSDALYLDNLHAFWMKLPQTELAAQGVGAVEHMIRVGTMFVIPTDRFDTSTYSQAGSDISAYCYENYPGGFGVARKLFDAWSKALEKGVEIAQNCPCSSGCQNCIEPAKSWDISNANIDKTKGFALAEELLAAFNRGPDRRYRDGLMEPI